MATFRIAYCLIIGIASWLPDRLAAAPCDIQLQPIDAYAVPAETVVDGFRFGGISGLDYDRHSHRWHLVSDDRKEYLSARIFSAELRFDLQHVIAFELRSGHLVDDTAATDAETVRFDSQSGNLLVAGEGDAARRIGPWLRRVTLSGHALEQVELPALFAAAFGSEQRGPRPNGSIEGLTFDGSNRGLWIALETPLKQDGPVASDERGVDVRLTWRHPSGSAQYVYPIDAARTHAAGEASDSGVSEILTLNARELLVLERSGTRRVDGTFRFHTRLYCADTSNATDVSAFDSLADRRYRRSTKRLLYDFDSFAGVTIDNLEGMSWGPRLGRGQRSLVFVSDNNLSAGLATQLIVFAVR